MWAKPSAEPPAESPRLDRRKLDPHPGLPGGGPQGPARDGPGAKTAGPLGETHTPSPTPNSSPYDPQALGCRLQKVGQRLVALTREGLEKKFTPPILECVEELRLTWSALRKFIVIRDTQSAKALLKEGQQLRRTVETLRGTLDDLSRTNEKAAATVEQQVQQLAELEGLGAPDAVVSRLRAVADNVRGAAKEMNDGIARSTANLAASKEIINTVDRRLTEASEQVQKDSLTGLPSRVALEERIEELAAQSSAMTASWCVVVAEVDRLAAVNQEHGRPVGDALLWRVAKVIWRICETHPGAFVGRWDGDQFGILLPGCSLRGGRQMAEELCGTIGFSKWQCKATNPPTVVTTTVSVGVAQHRGGESTAELCERVAACVEGAKRRGRDGVVAAD